MNVIQRPGAVELAADMPDYIIDTDSTITFSVQFNGQTILSEECVPDAAYQVCVSWAVSVQKLCGVCGRQVELFFNRNYQELSVS